MYWRLNPRRMSVTIDRLNTNAINTPRCDGLQGTNHPFFTCHWWNFSRSSWSFT